MAKFCGLCQKKIGIFSSGAKVSNGFICKDCLKKGGLVGIENLQDQTVEELSNFITERSPMIISFSPEKGTGSQIQIDRKNRLFFAKDCIFSFDEMISFSYIEKPDRGSSATYGGGINGAALGAMMGRGMFSIGRTRTGLIRGAAGAAIGGAIGGAIGNSVGNLFAKKCKSMKVVVHLDHPFMHEFTFKYIDTETSVHSDEYKHALKQAESCIEILTEIADNNARLLQRKQMQLQQSQAAISMEILTEIQQSGYRYIPQEQVHSQQSQIAQPPKETIQPQRSPEEEVRLLYRLWQDGVITSEEFQSKKEQLLGL